MPGFKLDPHPSDSYPTDTSRLQAETEEILLKHIPSAVDPSPPLQKNSHIQFLVRNLLQGFPVRYISQDASQPWLMYWTLHAFSLLQVGLDPDTRQRYGILISRRSGARIDSVRRAIDTILSWQHQDGGFGGGPGQAPHLLPTYAAICSLAIAGGPGPKGGWDQINR
jgi:protein farnesyltransferase subunit beta